MKDKKQLWIVALIVAGAAIYFILFKRGNGTIPVSETVDGSPVYPNASPIQLGGINTGDNYYVSQPDRPSLYTSDKDCASCASCKQPSLNTYQLNFKPESLTRMSAALQHPLRLMRPGG